MKVLITGSRWWKSIEHVQKIHDHLVRLPEDTTIVHGDCKGVDLIADAIARELNFIVIPCPANWTLYKKRAGRIRNQEMYDKESPFDLVLAFHDDIENSKGTKHMVSIVRELSPETKIIIVQ